MIPADIKEFLSANGLKAIEFEEGSTPTAETAASMLKVTVGQIAKSILFKGKDGNFYLVVCAGDKKISTAKLKTLTGTKTRMANAQELYDILGFRPGEVCPFRKTDIPVYIDVSLAEYETVYPAAGSDSSGVPVSFAGLLDITGALECDVTSES